MVQSYLQHHLESILNSSVAQSNLWRDYSDYRKNGLLENWHQLNSFVACSTDIQNGHYLCSRQASLMFLLIQEKEFAYSRIRPDWSIIVGNYDEKMRIFYEFNERLEHLCSKSEVREHLRLYGGVKSRESLDRKLNFDYGDRPFKNNVLDLWDVVRFRIVASGIEELLQISIEMWRLFIDAILRCRNYYYHPRNEDHADPYRAIHFELTDDYGNIVEVQLLTQYRESIDFLDHPFTFKKLLPFIDENHKLWLDSMSMSANILDVEKTASILSLKIRNEQLEKHAKSRDRGFDSIPSGKTSDLLTGS